MNKIMLRKGTLMLIVVVIITMSMLAGCEGRDSRIDKSNQKEGLRTSMGEESSVSLNEEELELANFINEERKNGGLAPLEFTSKLNECALLKANDMIENNYFSHLSPTHGSPFDMIKSHGVNFDEAIENIVGATTPEEAINRWMNDKNQRVNILNGTLSQGGLAISDSPVYGKIMVLLAISNS